MNVVRMENTLAPARGRGGGRGRVGIFAPNSNPIINVLPKYDFKTDRQPLVNMAPTTSTSTMVTPKNPRRYQTTTSSSSVRKSALLRRAGQITSGGQISPRSNASEVDHCVIIAITSGRGDARGEVGIAAVDLRSPHMILSQISDCNTYINTLTKIHTLNPVEIIMPDTMCERSIYPNGLYQAIKEKFASINITSLARMHFHDSSGLDRIRTHCAEEYSSVVLFVKQKYYALAAASALLKYVEYIQNFLYAPKSLIIDYQGSQNTAMIDIESAQSLELVSSQGGSRKFSLLGSLDHCSTPMGRRLLRASILQPPSELNVIQGRQACVAEFVSNRSFHSIVKPVVKRMYGASRLLSLAMLTSQADSVQAAEKNLNYILLLKNIIDIIPELRSVMANGRAPFFKKVFEDLKDVRYQSIKEKILSVVHPNARSVMGFTSSNMQRCFAIRSGLNDMLDIARQTYCELIDDMRSIVEKLSEHYNLQLSLGCNAKLGYHIEMDVRRSQNIRINDLPDELIEVHKNKSTIYMTTEYLLVLSQHCRDACEELHIMSNVLLNETLNDVREHIGCLLKLSDNVGELDLLMSIAQVSSISNYVMPIFGKKLELRDSRHPIMDIMGTDSPIANDVVASVAHNFHTITGPNMSGKSVYLKQIVLLQIMAQIGCCVPASNAEFRIADRIFCRMCSNDDTDCNASTFVLEIKQAQYLLQSITPKSLIILDELCRGTTVEEGTSLAWSICEKLVRTTAFTFNATHFLYLTRLSEIYCNVRNNYFETEPTVLEESSNDSRLIYTHILKPGITSVWNYGIALASSTGLPDPIVKASRKFADIEKTVTPLDLENHDNSWKNKIYDCVAEMNSLLENDEFTVNNIVKLVNELKIPQVVRNMKEGGLMKERKELEEITSSPRLSLSNFEISKNDAGHLLSKRLSTTSISSEVEVKKARLCSQESSHIPTHSPFNYMRQSGRSKNSLRSYEILAKSSQIPVENLSPAGRSKTHFEITFGAQRDCENTTNTVNRISGMRNDDANDDFFREISQNSMTQPGTSQHYCRPEFVIMSSELSSGISNTQSSVDTYIAKRTARKKEADIFKVLQGDDFDEAAFLGSLQSSIHSSDEDVV